ncbi:TadE/TadG family type IV pilus assembly protein [Pelagibacterium halotolerans]|uniref:TadE/TadG family type IV pilus assembly protein n=1 Tax=Pelagibacterium halotolerans TaxID=531813 RepID=UPI00384DE22B
MAAAFRRNTAGASAVEFALIVPVLLLLLFGTIEFSRLFWTSHALHQTAIAGARCMGIPQIECSDDASAYSEPQTRALIESKLRGWFVSTTNSTITLDPDRACHGLDGFSVVSISHRFQTVLPDIVLALAGGAEMQASACFPNQ